MESHEILREAFQQTSPKEIAAEMGLSLSLVYKWAQPGEGKGSGVDNPLDRVIQLVRLTQNPRLMEWLCQKAGGNGMSSRLLPRGLSVVVRREVLRNHPHCWGDGFKTVVVKSQGVMRFRARARARALGRGPAIRASSAGILARSLEGGRRSRRSPCRPEKRARPRFRRPGSVCGSG